MCAADYVVRFTRPPFLHTASDQKLEAGRPGNEAKLNRFGQPHLYVVYRKRFPKFIRGVTQLP